MLYINNNHIKLDLSGLYVFSCKLNLYLGNKKLIKTVTGFFCLFFTFKYCIQMSVGSCLCPILVAVLTPRDGRATGNWCRHAGAHAAVCCVHMRLCAHAAVCCACRSPSFPTQKSPISCQHP